MTPETLFDCLPLRFTRNEAIDKGEQVGVPAGSVDSLLKRMTERGQLVGGIRMGIIGYARTCVGVERLQVLQVCKIPEFKMYKYERFPLFPIHDKG